MAPLLLLLLLVVCAFLSLLWNFTLAHTHTHSHHTLSLSLSLQNASRLFRTNAFQWWTTFVSFFYLLFFVAFFKPFCLIEFYFFARVCTCVYKKIYFDWFSSFFCPNQSKIQIYLLEFFFFASTQFLFSQWNSSVFFLIFKWSIRKNFQISLEKKRLHGNV